MCWAIEAVPMSSFGATMSPAADLAAAPIGRRHTVRERLSYVGRWLRADLGDVVRIDPGDHAVSGAPGSALIPGLERWRASVGRRRTVALARRWLLVALAVAVLLELIGVLAGAGTTARALGLIGPAVLWVAGVAVGHRRRPGIESVAQLLDHDLGLAEVVTTALELEQGSAPDRPSPALGGLPALVLVEGAAAVSRSWGSARVASTSAWPERLAPAALAAIVGLLIALPSSGSGAVSRNAGRHGAAASTGSAAASGAASHDNAPAKPAAVKRRGTPKQSAAARPNSGQAPTAQSQALAPGTPTGKTTAGAPQRSPAVRGAAATRGAGAGQPRAGGQTGSTPHSPPSSASGGQASNRAGARGGLARGTSASHSASGASAARASRAGVPHRPGQPAGSSSKAASGLVARPGAAGGESAGRAGAGNVVASRPAPGSVRSATGLPIQTGYAASTGKAGEGRERSGRHRRARFCPERQRHRRRRRRRDRLPVHTADSEPAPRFRSDGRPALLRPVLAAPVGDLAMTR